MLTANKDMNMKAIFAVMYQSSWVQIPYSPEFFSGLIFTTAQVVFITAKIAFIFMSLSAVQMYYFHIITFVYYNFITCS